MSKIFDAVSLVLCCGEEIFAVQRQNFLSAFPGYWAFPGGKVEKDDAAHALVLDGLKELDAKILGAAVREGREELGIDLREEHKNGHVVSIDYLGLATTPDFNPYRFATYFIKVNLTKKIKFEVDRNEAHFADWMSCAELLEKYNRGQLLAVPPVIKVIERLGKKPDTTFIPDLNFDYDKSTYVPYIESLKGIKQIMPLSHTLPPATRTNSFLIGDADSEQVLIDPSPCSDEEYVKFRNTISLFGVSRIFLTHHHPDHYEMSNRLARELGVPVFMSQDTHSRILERAPEFFNEVEVHHAKEGDVLTRWLGKRVLIMAVPGHDEGQLAPYAEDLSWFIAGDLFQGVGTVVIGGAEGDMRKYFATLERVIALSPKVLFPSHGIGLGGTSILEKTLTHRKMREEQILRMYQEGNTIQQMLEVIYAEVPRELWPYALENIDKHLQKLRAEKII